MKLDDLKQDWQQTLADDSTSTNLDEVIKGLEKETVKMDKEIKRRDWLEISIAVLLIPAWIYGLFTTVSLMQTIGYCIAITSCIYIPYKLLAAKKVAPQKDSSLKEYLRQEKQKLTQQKQLLESIVWWYIAPLTTAIVLITMGGTVDETGLPQISRSLAYYYGCVALLVVGIYLLNKRAAKKKFAPLLKNVEQRLAELTD